MNTLARDVNISGFQEAGKSQESALNVKVLIGIRKRKNKNIILLIIGIIYLISYE